MSNISKDEIVDIIVETIKLPFEKKGFSLKRKRFFECEDTYGNIQQYEIYLSKLKGWFSLHLRLNILNKSLLKKVNVILEKTLLDETYPYPDVWDENFIKSSIKARVGNYFLTGLTDWKIFKDEDESYEAFNNRFSIWICHFDSIGEIENWESQLLQSVEFANVWFSITAKDDEWIINNTEYPALCLLKEEKRLEELESKYTEILSRPHIDKEEVQIFYRYLIS